MCEVVVVVCVVIKIKLDWFFLGFNISICVSCLYNCDDFLCFLILVYFVVILYIYLDIYFDMFCFYGYIVLI